MSDTIRILHIVTYMNRGGLETMIMNYYRHVDREKVQFDFLVHRRERADYDDEIERLGGKIYRISRLVPWSFSYKKKLYDFFKDHPEYDIVHVHQDCLSSVALQQAKKAGVPIRIAHCHSSSQDKNLKYIVKLFYKRFIPRYSTDLFACGMDAGNWMFGGADFKVINNAIAVKNYLGNDVKRNELRSKLGLSNEFTLGLVARFTPAKNHSFLLDVFNEIRRLDTDTKLLLVGDGELRGVIEAKIKELNLTDSVILTGVRNDVPDLLQAMDAFVMPSLYEGFGIVALEAQASGIPCYISDKVPKDCMVTDLVRRLSLSDPPEVWAKAILKTKGNERKNTYHEIIGAGFDIEENARWLQSFYKEKRELVRK